MNMQILENEIINQSRQINGERADNGQSDIGFYFQIYGNQVYLEPAVYVDSDSVQYYQGYVYRNDVKWFPKETSGWIEERK